jgi:hypothetical protein
MSGTAMTEWEELSSCPDLGEKTICINFVTALSSTEVSCIDFENISDKANFFES